MRIPYAPDSPPTANNTDAAIYERIKQRRHPRPLLPLDLALLQAPPVADGWNSFLGAIRNQTVLDNRFLELAVCRIAALNGAAFEWAAHCPLALKAGVSPGLLERVKSAESLDRQFRWFQGGKDTGESVQADERESVILTYTDAMTKKVRVDDEVFARVKQLFSEREVVEVTATIAAYNCVSRFLVALDVGEMNELEIEKWKVT